MAAPLCHPCTSGGWGWGGGGGGGDSEMKIPSKLPLRAPECIGMTQGSTNEEEGTLPVAPRAIRGHVYFKIKN